MAYRDGGTAAQGVYKANHGRKQGIEDSEHFNSAQHARHIINVRERDLYLDSYEVWIVVIYCYESNIRYLKFSILQ